jgi:hypothetical protein
MYTPSCPTAAMAALCSAGPRLRAGRAGSGQPAGRGGAGQQGCLAASRQAAAGGRAAIRRPAGGRPSSPREPPPPPPTHAELRPHAPVRDRVADDAIHLCPRALLPQAVQSDQLGQRRLPWCTQPLSAESPKGQEASVLWSQEASDLASFPHGQRYEGHRAACQDAQHAQRVADVDSSRRKLDHVGAGRVAPA